LSAFLLYTVYVGSSITGLASFQAELMKGIGASTRLFEILHREPEFSSAGGVRPVAPAGEISFKNVSFRYPTRPEAAVLQGFSLDVPAGSIQAIVGSSGSGKSTVANLLLQLYSLEGGQILFDGMDMQGMDAQWLRERVISIVSQEPVLFNGTIAENIAYGVPEAEQEEVERVARIANAAGFISRFPEGYETMVGERGLSLSGGQRQRIAVARALLKDPKVLILDEATSALDTESEHLVQQALDRLMAGRTVIVIAHRLSTIKSADNIAVLEDGIIKERGSYSELAAREDGLFRRVLDVRNHHLDSKPQM